MKCFPSNALTILSSQILVNSRSLVLPPRYTMITNHSNLQFFGICKTLQIWNWCQVVIAQQTRRFRKLGKKDTNSCNDLIIKLRFSFKANIFGFDFSSGRNPLSWLVSKEAIVWSRHETHKWCCVTRTNTEPSDWWIKRINRKQKGQARTLPNNTPLPFPNPEVLTSW